MSGQLLVSKEPPVQMQVGRVSIPSALSAAGRTSPTLKKLFDIYSEGTGTGSGTGRGRGKKKGADKESC